MKTPKLPPLIIKKSPSAFYVYTYKNKWDSEKKRSYRASFKKVGTVTSGEKEGRIRWDDHFLAERPELRDFICERKGKDYVFTPMNEGGFTLSQAMEVKQLHAGATWALDQLVAQSPIGGALKRAFPQRRDYLKVLSVAYFIILNQDNNISKYPTFAEATRLPWGAPLHPSSIGRIFRKIKKQQIENYFSAVQEGLIEQKKKAGDDDKLTLALDSTSISSYANFRKIKKQQIENYFSAVQEGLIEQKKKAGDDDKLTLALDSTSISSYANKLPNVERGRNKDEDNVQEGLIEQKKKAGDDDKLTLALDSTSISSYANKLPNVERGRNKDEDKLPQINLLMLVESQSGLPIFYRTYDGNVPDVQTVRRVIADNSRLGIQNVVLVSDLGYSGTKNINDCLRNKVGFLFNMKCGVSGSLTQELIDEERLNLQDLNRRDWYTQVFQVTKKISWIYEPSPVKNQRSTKKTLETAELYWHIYFDRQIAENARQGLFERIDRVQEKIANGKALDENEQTLLRTPDKDCSRESIAYRKR